MATSKEKEVYGFAFIEPVGKVVAGSYTTIRLTYVAGTAGISSIGHIQIQTDSDTDWELPQFEDSRGPDYMTIQSPAASRISVMVKDFRTILLTVTDKGLKPGEQISLIYGDTSKGSPGTRAQTFVEKKRYFWVSVDSKGDGNFVTLKDSPYISIIGGKPSKLLVIAPSFLEPNESFRLIIKAQDEYGNPSPNYQGAVKIQGNGVILPASDITFPNVNEGVYVLDGCRCPDSGLYRISLLDEKNSSSSRSNPIFCSKEVIKFRLYWGDPHGGQVKLAEKVPEFFKYARDVSVIDFTGYQRNDHDLSSGDWMIQQEAELEFYQPGKFVPLPGFEWSGAARDGGHHNVYFRRHHQPIRRSGQRGLRDKSEMDKNLSHIADVYRTYRYHDVMIVPHVGGYPADLSYHDPDLEPVIEITSTHGSFEWFLEDAIQRGYKVGFVGGSDGYTGRPGGEYPGYLERRYSKGGFTGLYSEGLTIESVHEAIKSRRCYATTGERIIAKLTIDDHFMGEEYFSRSLPNISAFIAGTAPLETIDLFRGIQKIYSHPIPLLYSKKHIRILWDGASAKTSYTGVVWDGRLSVTGAEITDIEQIRFDSPRSKVFDRMESSVKWHSISCGYPSGLVLTLNKETQADIELIVNVSLIRAPDYGGFGNLPPLKLSYYPAERFIFKFNIEELEIGAKVLNIGPLKRKLTVSLAPKPGAPETVEFRYIDQAPNPGINPYWVRAKQTDMEMVWTSPVFLDYAG